MHSAQLFSVVDPHWMVSVRIQEFENNKILQLKKENIWWEKNCNIFILRPPWRTSKLQEKPPDLKTYRNIQHFKTINFSTSYFLYSRSFLLIQIRIRIPMRIRILNTACNTCTSSSCELIFTFIILNELPTDRSYFAWYGSQLPDY